MGPINAKTTINTSSAIGTTTTRIASPNSLGIRPGLTDTWRRVASLQSATLLEYCECQGWKSDEYAIVTCDAFIETQMIHLSCLKPDPDQEYCIAVDGKCNKVIEVWKEEL